MRDTLRLSVLLTSVALLSACGPEHRDGRSNDAVIGSAVHAPALIPRRVIFGEAERINPAISPDGRWLAYVAPVDDVPNVVIAPREKPRETKAITHDTARGVRDYVFAYDNKHLLYAQDADGDENYRLFALDLATAQVRALTPEGARAEIDNLSPRVPGAVVVNLTRKAAAYADLVRIEIASGKMETLVANKAYAAFLTDEDFVPRLASKPTDAGGKEWYVRKGSAWRPWSSVAQEDAITTSLLGFSANGNTLYLTDSRGRDTAALVAVDWTSGARTVLLADPAADVSRVMSAASSGTVQAALSDALTPAWHVVDPAVSKDIRYLTAVATGGTFAVASQSLDDRFWVVRIDNAAASPRYVIYDRTAGTAQPWFEAQPELRGLPLRPMHPVALKSRDGLTLASYYTLPAEADSDSDGKPERRSPLVVLVHGGPWDRDAYGFRSLHQWLANRGYAVLAVNFRGSTGFGKAFINAGNLEWGRKMQDDLLDGVDWAVTQGITDRDKVAIVGSSYGGYAALAGLSMTPKAFACGVSVVGPSNLITLLETIPAYWGPTRSLFTSRVGNPDTPQGRKLLIERSPLSHVNGIERPLLIGQGANDPRVKRSESDQIVAAMQARNIPVTYAVFPDEGHGFLRTENEMAFSAVVEAFLGRCLGGRVEPVGRDFEGSSITVPTGAALLPGVQASLAKR